MVGLWVNEALLLAQLETNGTNACLPQQPHASAAAPKRLGGISHLHVSVFVNSR